METISMWGWIATELDKVGYAEASKLARKIDSAMVDIYGTSITKGWEADLGCGDIDRAYERYCPNARIKFICEELLRHCADGRKGYDIACVLEGNICDKCKFAKEHLKCNDADSLYRKFRKKLGYVVERGVE